MRIKILSEDALFSRWIRKRDGKCMRCGSKVGYNPDGEPITHQNSHYWGRRNWGVRFDPENCDTLCFYCHQQWGGDYRRDYEAFKRKQLGEISYRNLEIRKNMYCKRDRKLAMIFVRALIQTNK